MFSDVFLAQTAWEYAQAPAAKTAYMACHFSSAGCGLSNLPAALPPGSILLVDDSMPPMAHDPEVVARQLQGVVAHFSVGAVLLDFQGEYCQAAANIARYLLQTLPCPVAVTEDYAKELACAVFLGPTPVNMALQEHIAPWKNGVFLEIAPDATQFTVTEEGATALPIIAANDLPLQDGKLHCHYNVEVFPEKAIFTLSRTGADLEALAKSALQLGVLGVIGLYQELRSI